MRRCTRAFQGAVLLAGLVVAPSLAFGQTFTWNNATGSWSDPTQWVGNVGPVGTSVYGADTLVFGGAGPAYVATNDFNDGDANRPAFFMLNHLNLTSTVAGSSIVGSSAYPNPVRLAFAGPSPSIDVTGSGGFILENPLNAFDGDTLAINVAPGAGQLRIGPPPGTATSTALYGHGTYRITNNSSNTILLGNIGDFSGTLDIQGTGATMLSQETGSWLQPTTIINVGAGATFNMNNNDDQIGGITGAGNIELGTAYLRFDQIIDQDWSGTISNTVGTHEANPDEPTILKWFGSRDSTLTWRGNNTYRGETDIRAGMLKLVDGGRISGTNDSIDDFDNYGIIVYQSELRLDNTGTANNNDRVNDLADIKLAGKISLLGRASTSTTETLGKVTIGAPPGVPEQGVVTVLSSGQATINVVNGAGGTATLTMRSLSRGPFRGTTLNFTGDGTVNITIAPTLYNGIIGGWATYGNEWATMSGNTVAPLASYQTNANPANWAATDNVKITGALSANVTTKTINTLNFASNQTMTITAANTVTIGAGGILASTSGTITGGTLQVGLVSEGSRDMKVHVPNAGTTLTVNSVIGSTGTPGLTKTGDGTLILGGTNTYGTPVASGANGQGQGTNFEGGVVQISAPANLGSATSQLTFSGGTLRISADLTMPTGRAISSAGVRGMTIDTNGFNFSTAGSSVGGYGGVVKRGLGTWTINESNSFDGDLWVEQGKVVASGTAGSTFDNTTILHVSAGAEFDFADNIEDFGGIEGNGTITTGVAPGTLLRLLAVNTDNHVVTFNGVLQGAGALDVVTWPFKQSFGGQSTYTGKTRITTGGAIVTANVMPTANGPLGNPVGAAEQEIQLGDNNSSTIWTSLEIGTAGVEVGRNILVERGTDSIIGGIHTTGTSTFSGLITLTKKTHFQALGTSTVAVTGNIVDFDPFLGETGGVVKIGSGTVTLSGANSYSGGTYVADGTLLVNGTNSGTGAVIVASDGTLGGTGTLSSNATVFGTLAPGASIGTLSVSAGSVTVNGTMAVEVSGASIDLLSITGGGLTLGSGSILDIQGTLNQPSYTIATYDSGTLVGTFGNIADVTGQGYFIHYNATNIVLDTTAALPVPEPSTLTMAVLALTGLLGFRGYRRRCVS